MRPVLVCGDGANRATFGKTDYDDILTNFAPIAKRRAAQAASFKEQREEIDLLIATDCISEGQNLQDCDLLVNYDIHWNPVRIIQRFGRIDRIGSRSKEVRLVNFWPVAELDSYINVKHRVESRMALVDIAATQTDNILDTEQLEELIDDDMLFRERQLKKMKDEVVDLEDIDNSVSLTDFSLDEFRMDLLRYIEANKTKLEEAEEGLYAIVPAKPEFPAAQPGALFCLRHKQSSNQVRWSQGDTKRLNPLDPYYIVYIKDDAEIRFKYTRAKESIMLFRGLAAGEQTAFESLCDIFDKRTNDGLEMMQVKGYVANTFGYDLSQSVASIIASGYGFDETCQRTVPEAFTCFLESDSFEDAVRKAVLLRGDADTLACIAGSLAEPFYGIPPEIESQALSHLDRFLLDTVLSFKGRRSDRHATDLS